jgi:L-iditol 2-dehydrogenase
MKALVLKEYNHLEYIDVPAPEVPADHVLVRIQAVGICGSDVHGVDGSTGRRIPPIIMGHEAAGIIEATGRTVSLYSTGERVTFDSTIYCGTCYFCRKGMINFCENRKVLGVGCDEYHQDGAFAEFVAVPERILYRLPQNITFHQAAMVEPVSIAVHAVGITDICIGDSAVVFGAGVIGVLTMQVLLSSGCGKVYIVDINQSRLDLAKQLGATEVFNSKDVDIVSELVERTDGRGVNLAFDAVGIAETFNAAVHSVIKGGQVTVIGNIKPETSFPLQYVVSRQITIRGSNASSGEYPACLEMIQSGHINVDSLISAKVPLSEGSKWFEKLRKGEPGLMKVLLEP